MKIFLLILVFFVFLVFAIFVYFKYYLRFILFKDMVYISKSLKNQISFNKNNLEKIINDISKNVSSYTRFIMNSNKNKYFLFNKQDVELISEFFTSLGHGDLSYEISNITYYENLFEENKSNFKNKLNTEGKLYFKLIIGFGLAVCIILI